MCSGNPKKATIMHLIKRGGQGRCWSGLYQLPFWHSGTVWDFSTDGQVTTSQRSQLFTGSMVSDRSVEEPVTALCVKVLLLSHVVLRAFGISIKIFVHTDNKVLNISYYKNMRCLSLLFLFLYNLGKFMGVLTWLDIEISFRSLQRPTPFTPPFFCRYFFIL